MDHIPATLAPLAVPVDRLKPRKGNPRRGDVSRIAESLEANGQYRPLVVNKRTNEVLAGNHTLAAAKRLGWVSIAVTYVDVDEDAAARIVLADNRTADAGDYDEQLLADALRGLDDLTGTGYTDDDLDALIKATDNDGDAPLEEEELTGPQTTCTPGQVYSLGGHLFEVGDGDGAAEVCAFWQQMTGEKPVLDGEEVDFL